MGRPKRSTEPQRKWTIEKKVEIIRKHLDDHMSLRNLQKEFEVNLGTIHSWISK